MLHLRILSAQIDGIGINMIILLFVLAVFIIVCVISQIHYEDREWNDGFCKRCGNVWCSFDVDSSGAVGYKCFCKRVTWQSYRTRTNKDFS